MDQALLPHPTTLQFEMLLEPKTTKLLIFLRALCSSIAFRFSQPFGDQSAL